MHTCYTTNIFLIYRSLHAIRPFRVLPGSFWPLLTIVCFCPPNLGPFIPTSLFFLLALPSWHISPPRRSLTEKLRGEQSGWRCHKRKWQFRWENGNSNGGSDGVPFALSYPLDARKFVYASSHSVRPKKARRREPKNISRPLGFLFQSFGGECRLTWFSGRTRRGTTCRNYCWPMATISRSTAGTASKFVTNSRVRLVHISSAIQSINVYKYN